jgi:hypothetical protein
MQERVNPHKANLLKLMETNKNISGIRELAFQIKIKSINEQILAIRNDLSTTGFHIVSREFINFSKTFEELADEMQFLMDEMLDEVAHSLKKSKLDKHRFLAESLSKKKISSTNVHNSTSQEINIATYKIPNRTKLKNIINKASLLSLKGNNIFMQSKITGAYIHNNEKNSLLNTLTIELGDIMDKVRVRITNIKKIWI